mgnify:FL=1
MTALVSSPLAVRAARPPRPERVALDGSVLGIEVALGPFETPAVALRWVLREPWNHCLGSGWLGEDFVLRADDGRRVHVPLRGLRLVAPRSRWSPPFGLEPHMPAWIEDVVGRQWRFFRSSETRWIEAPIQAGDRVRIEACLEPCDGDYRSAGTDVDAIATNAAGPIAVFLG